MPPSLTQRLSLTDNHLQMKTWFPPRESHKGNKVLLREAASRSRWPTEKKLSGILRGSLPYNVLSSHLDFILLFLILINLFISYSLFTPQVLCVYILMLSLLFLWDSQCVNEWVSASCDFSLGFVVFSPFVLSHSNVLVFTLSYILLYYHPVEACWFSNMNQKGSGSG